MESKFQENFDDEGNSVFECLVCGKQVNLKRNMRQHVKNMHLQATDNVCEYCHKVFKNDLSCSRHKKGGKCQILKFGYLKYPSSTPDV